MQLRLVRTEFYSSNTIGKLYVDGKFECFTLEDTVRTGPKVYGETAIPVGKYRVTVELSPRFKRLLPRLHGVPQFSGVLIHSGNKAADTEGCILVGRTEKDSWIEESKIAFDALLYKLQQSKDDIYIEIVNEEKA